MDKNDERYVNAFESYFARMRDGINSWDYFKLTSDSTARKLGFPSTHPISQYSGRDILLSLRSIDSTIVEDLRSGIELTSIAKQEGNDAFLPPNAMYQELKTFLDTGDYWCVAQTLKRHYQDRAKRLKQIGGGQDDNLVVVIRLFEEMAKLPEERYVTRLRKLAPQLTELIDKYERIRVREQQ